MSMSGLKMIMLLLLLVGAILNLHVVAAQNQPQEVVVELMDNCQEHKNLTNYLNDTTFRYDPIKNELRMSGIFYIRETVPPNGTRMEVIFMQCIAEDDDNSCDKRYLAFEEDFCDKIGAPGMVWSSIVSAMKDFEPKCPIPRGEYKIDSALLDMSTLLTMGVSNGVWKVHALFTYEKKMMMCLETSGRVRTARRKRTKKPKPLSEAFRLESVRRSDYLKQKSKS